MQYRHHSLLLSRFKSQFAFIQSEAKTSFDHCKGKSINMNVPSYQYHQHFDYKGKVISQPSYLMGIPIPGKTVFILIWDPVFLPFTSSFIVSYELRAVFVDGIIGKMHIYIILKKKKFLVGLCFINTKRQMSHTFEFLYICHILCHIFWILDLNV